MAIKLVDQEFDGPFISTEQVEEKPGVFAVVCVKDNRGQVIDAGESDDLKSGIETHARAEAWHEQCDGTLGIAVCYTDEEADRRTLLDSLRAQFTLSEN